MVQAQREDNTILSGSRVAADEQFTAQVEQLLSLGYPTMANMTEGVFLDKIEPLRRIFELGSIIVIPEEVVTFAFQLEAVGGRVVSHHRAWTHGDSIEMPDVPFISAEVDDGRGYHDKSPLACMKHFQTNDRFGLSVIEGIALVTHRPKTLRNHHCVDLPGSYCGRDLHAPQLRHWGELILDNRFNWSPLPTSGSASCRARLAP
ncbi:MAG TPA: hypothetical protein DEB73_02450 [Candidatus Magasanikbacteria bacterium]|nr:hypothetical protein [Candidatus Magasanikbacteria bacterium]